jgi:glycerophosphoryl diester phosphodiesterase
VVAASQSQKRVIFSSFNPFSLRRLSRYLPEVPRALLATEADEPGNRFYLRKMLLAFLARPHMLNLDWRYYTAEKARDFAQRQVPVSVWTVNDPAQARKLLALGAKSIISDQPNLI